MDPSANTKPKRKLFSFKAKPKSRLGVRIWASSSSELQEEFGAQASGFMLRLEGQGRLMS